MDLLTLLGGGLFGFDISSMAGVLGTDAYKRYFHNPRSYGQGAITAAMPFGSLVGALSSSFLADKYSRKVSIQIASIIWIIGSTYVSHLFPLLCLLLTCTKHPMRFRQCRYASRRACYCWSLRRYCFIHLSCLSSRNRSKGNPWTSRQSSTMGHHLGYPDSVLHPIRSL
jgi:MFS family permease